MKKDKRNLCPKFLSSACPNICHYADWCKYEKEIKKSQVNPDSIYFKKDAGY